MQDLPESISVPCDRFMLTCAQVLLILPYRYAIHRG